MTLLNQDLTSTKTSGTRPIAGGRIRRSRPQKTIPNGFASMSTTFGIAIHSGMSTTLPGLVSMARVAG